jgi:hypothetical protein
MPLQIASPPYWSFSQESEGSLGVSESLQRRNVRKCRRRDVEKELESAKKNSESNIINQLYSFFSNLEKS